MPTTLKSGDIKFQIDVEWAKLPAGWHFVEVSDVAVDPSDRVYVFNRGEHPMIVFNRDGTFLRSWGEGIFKRPHGLTVGPDECLYCADDGDHSVKKFTLDGKLLLIIGTPNEAATFQSGTPFNRPTKVAFDPKTGEIYVSDGYGNSRVHKYSPGGKLLFSWGEPGSDPGQFNLVHSVCTDSDGYVYVADRENHRVQIFDSLGQYVTQWNNMHRPCGMYIDTRERLCYIGELPPSLPINRNYPNLGAHLDIYDLKGRRLARFGDRRPGEEPTQFWAPHGIAKDSKGDLYIAEVSWSLIGSTLNPPKELRSFRKLIR